MAPIANRTLAALGEWIQLFVFCDGRRAAGNTISHGGFLGDICRLFLAYSGGLDTSIILRWLQEKYNAEVISYTADIGQKIDKEKIIKNAKKLGVKKIIIENLKDLFVKEYIYPMVRGHAIYEGVYLLGTSIARPLIAKRQIAIAKKFNAHAVSHGSTGKGNDQVRFELGYHYFGPKIKVIAPLRIWKLNSRSDLIKYAKKIKY